MHSSSSHAERKSRRGARTLAELVCYLDTPEKRRELEEFRIKYEVEFGITDLSRRYTSMLPVKDQEWLLKNHPKHHWDGLPPFVQAYLRDKFVAAGRIGKLDDMPASYLSLFCSDQMSIGNPGQSR
jgi:hypothetical protein